MSTLRSILAAACAAWLAGCAGPSATGKPDDRPLEDRFRIGRTLMRGSDPVDTGGSWRPGDTALLGAAIDGPGGARELYIRITTSEKMTFSSGSHSITIGDNAEFKIPEQGTTPAHVVRAAFDLVPLYVETFDGSGKKLGGTLAMMPEPCLKYGLTEYIEIERAGQTFTDPARQGTIVNGVSQATESQVREMAGWLALVRLPAFLNREKSMGGVLGEIVRRPGLGSILFHGGISVTLGMPPESAEPVPPPPPWTGACYRMPVEVKMNGEHATDCTLTIARADPPLGPCNGLLELDASHPDDPSRRVRVRLLAAKRGKPAP